MKEKGARLLVDIAAWPPTETCGDPLPAWKKCSAITGLPMWVCNQTGNIEWMDMTVGLSAVVENGSLQLSYKGDEAILFFDWSD
jgi:N-carbamoylputrescine amidase